MTGRVYFFSKNASFDGVFWDEKCAIWKRGEKKKEKRKEKARAYRLAPELTIHLGQYFTSTKPV